MPTSKKSLQLRNTGHLWRRMHQWPLSLFNGVCHPVVHYWDYYPGALPSFNSLRLRQNGRHFPDDIFKWIFLNENVWISIKLLLKFVPRGPINNIPTLIQVMAWRRLGDKPLSEPMMVRLPTYICVTRPQWVKSSLCNSFEDWAPIDFIYGCAIFKKSLRYLNTWKGYQDSGSSDGHQAASLVRNELWTWPSVQYHSIWHAYICLYNSLRPSDAYMHQQIMPSLIHIMAWHLFDVEPSSESMLVYCQLLDSKEHNSMNFYLETKSFHSWKCIWKCGL